MSVQIVTWEISKTILTMTVAHIFTVNFLFFFFLQLTDINEYVLMNKNIPILLRLARYPRFVHRVYNHVGPAGGSSEPVNEKRCSSFSSAPG